MRTRSGQRPGRSATLAFFLLLATQAAARAEDFDGVQPTALDQPRVMLQVLRQPAGRPLAGDVQAFLDTGASGILLSTNTASTLGVLREHAGPDEVNFHDIGVAGGDAFAVSEPLFISLPDDRLAFGPIRAQVGPLGGGVMDLLARQVIGDLDVAGMPAMAGRVVVMDATAVNKVADTIHTTVVDPRNAGATVPRTHRHVRLSFANFTAYTTITPTAASGPDMGANPFIGPSPLKPSGDRTPSVVVSHNGKQSAGSWLLDTGAATSMISRRQAAALGVTFVPGTQGTDTPQLAGVPIDQQFTMTIGGIGGSKKTVGFYLDWLTLATTEGQPINYLHAPVLVTDITAANTRTGTLLTLDGVFGMNFLVASAKLTDGMLPDIDHITPGPYRWIVFDQPKGLLGLD